MNERIKELAEQAGLEPTSGCWLFTPGIDVGISKAVANMKHSVELEKFAELIVRECSRVIVYGGYWTGGLIGPKRQCTPLEISQMIKEHFGVKE